MSKRIFVHIGLPKTATTYLQTIMWDARDQMRREGVLLPGREKRDHLWASRIVREDKRAQQRTERERTSWDRLQEELRAWPETGLVTHEFFAAASAAQARAMVEALAPAEVHVVVTAREPLGLFTASWQESLKNRSTTPMADYGRDVSDRPTMIWNWRTLDLRLVLQRWLEAVPAERIHVLPLDKTKPRDDIWHRYANLLGLDSGAYDTSQGFANQSMGVVEAELLRRINENLGEFKSSFDRGVYIRSFLADDRLVPRGGEAFWPRADQIDDCRRRGQEALEFLAAHPIDVIGDASALAVPDELPQRRTPDTVTDAEVAAAGAELIAVMLGDVRELRESRGKSNTSGELGAEASLPQRLFSRLRGG